MSIITSSNDSTGITLVGVQGDDFLNIDQSSSRTTGGESRTIRTGKKYATVESYRITGTELRQLIDLLTDNSTNYFFTPSVIPDTMSSSDFPMDVNIKIPTKSSQTGGGDKKYIIKINIESVSYL
jgi:hypothetical protein